MNVKSETIKLLEENIGDKLLDIVLGSDSFGSNSKSKRSNKQMGLHETKKPLHSKENHQQNEKLAYWIGENICKYFLIRG